MFSFSDWRIQQNVISYQNKMLFWDTSKYYASYCTSSLPNYFYLLLPCWCIRLFVLGDELEIVNVQCRITYVCVIVFCLPNVRRTDSIFWLIIDRNSIRFSHWYDKNTYEVLNLNQKRNLIVICPLILMLSQSNLPLYNRSEISLNWSHSFEI